MAVNISEVLEVAGNKVDNDVDAIRQKFNGKMQVLQKCLSSVIYIIEYTMREPQDLVIH